MVTLHFVTSVLLKHRGISRGKTLLEGNNACFKREFYKKKNEQHLSLFDTIHVTKPLSYMGAPLKEVIRKGYDAIFACIAPGLFSDCTSEIKFYDTTI